MISFNDYIKSDYYRISKLLIEQAMKLSDAESKITSLSYELAEHVLKLLLCKDTEYYNHWLSEIDSWLRVYSNIILKTTHKAPSNKQVNKWARTEWLNKHAFNNMLVSIKTDYIVKSDISFEKFNEIYEKILNLSVSGNYSKAALKQFLNYK